MQRLNLKNQHRAQELERIESDFDLFPESRKKDRLDQAMLEFVHDGPSVSRIRRSAQDALRVEEEIVGDIEKLVGQLKLY